MSDVYYFGCWREAGHYMWKPPMITDWDFLHSNPWGFAVDGTLYSKAGGASIHHKDGWTALAFIDNTVDNRPGSNSVFLARGIFDLAEMKQLAVMHFPAVAERVRIEHLILSVAQPSEQK